MIVVDASLAAKWILPEADSAEALSWLAQHQSAVAGPDLLLSEVSATIVRWTNERRISPSFAAQKMDEWMDIWRSGILSSHRLTPDLIDSAVRLAIALGHPLADCIYLALAIELDCPLATCDVKFRSKSQSVYPDIGLLSDFA